MSNFYDTCSLLLKANNLFEKEEQFVISSITLEELEEIKTSVSKDADIKYSARQLLRLLDEHIDEYKIHIFTEDMLTPIKEKNLTITNDMRILATAINYSKNNDINFITNDLALKTIAKLFFNSYQISSVVEEDDNYNGYLDIILNDNEMEQFYSNPYHNHFNNYINQYIIIRDINNNIVDRKVWTGEDYRPISFEIFDSRHFGKIKPLDVQQQCAADSFTHNKLTMIKGKPGSGKSILALGYLFAQLEKHQIDHIIVFCNTVAAKNSAKLGFYPGTRVEKLLDSQIGSLLSSKLGSKLEVERLIQSEELILLPMSDIRGFDTTGMRAGIYISEAQNLDISLMKLALQRIGEDSICIIDGDAKTQVDDIAFAGLNNGMRRVSKIFRGYDFYGEIELKEIHRSVIGKVADEM